MLPATVREVSILSAYPMALAVLYALAKLETMIMPEPVPDRVAMKNMRLTLGSRDSRGRGPMKMNEIAFSMFPVTEKNTGCFILSHIWVYIDSKQV